MHISNLKISINEYKRLVDEDIKKAGADTVYGSFLAHLSQLTAMTQYYFEDNAEGRHPAIDEKGYDNLIKCYSELAKDCNQFLAEDREKSKLEKKRINIVKRLASYIGKDMKGLVRADRTKKHTLSEIIKEARTKTIDLSGKKLGKVGGALSSRIPLKSSSGTEGFFTQKVVFNYDETLQDIMKKFASELPEALRRGLEDKRKLDNCLNTFVMYSDLDLDSPDEEVREESYKSLAKALNSLDLSIGENDIVNMLKEEPKFAASMLEVQQKYSGLVSQKYMNETVGIANKSRLDQRNAAMSDVASLLGMSNIIAKSIPMNIICDGQIMEGTFMEKANGEDLRNLTKDSLALQADKETFNHSKGLKQLADLQILDYICGNVDRHDCNIMYQFKKDDQGKVVLDGICGIDNDASFGTRLFETAKDTKELTPLSGIENMSMSCYEAFKNISTDALRITLADKLSKEEIDAVCKRVDLLSKKLERNEIHLVADNAWGKDGLTYDKISSGFGGISTTIRNAIETINRGKDAVDNLKETKSSLNYAEGKDVSNEAEFKFKEIYSKVEAFVSKSEKLGSIFHKNSVEYNNMLNALKKAQEIGKSISEKLNKKINVDLDVFEDFDKKVINLGVESQKYIDAKNVSQYTDRGKDRITLASDMRDLVQENFAMKEMPVEEMEL